MNAALVRVQRRDGLVVSFDTWAAYVEYRDTQAWLERRRDRIAVRDAQWAAEARASSSTA